MAAAGHSDFDEEFNAPGPLGIKFTPVHGQVC